MIPAGGWVGGGVEGWVGGETQGWCNGELAGLTLQLGAVCGEVRRGDTQGGCKPMVS
jgi:hypothetical protein